MKVRVLFFAAAKQVVGENQLDLELPEAATISELKKALVEKFPGLQEMIVASNWSLNQSYVADESSLSDGCEVGMILPVSGG